MPVFAESWLMPRLRRFNRLAPKIDIVLADGFHEGTVADVDIVIEWGAFESVADVEAERLTNERVFPVCCPKICPNFTLADATLVHRHNFPNRYDFPDWPVFLQSVGLESVEGLDPHAGTSVSGGLVMHAARSGLGVALANTTIAHDDLVAGRLVRPVPHSMETEVGYWLLIPNAVKERSEVKAFRAWLLDELAGSFDHSVEEEPELHPGGGHKR